MTNRLTPGDKGAVSGESGLWHSGNPPQPRRSRDGAN